MPEESLIQKIRSLPPERVAEVEDFVDFLTVRDQERHFTQPRRSDRQSSSARTPIISGGRTAAKAQERVVGH